MRFTVLKLILGLGCVLILIGEYELYSQLPDSKSYFMMFSVFSIFSFTILVTLISCLTAFEKLWDQNVALADQNKQIRDALYKTIEQTMPESKLPSGRTIPYP